MEQIITRLRAALAERSTLVGLALLLSLCGIHADAEVLNLGATALAALLGLYEVLRHEPAPAAPADAVSAAQAARLTGIVDLTREVQELRAAVAAKEAEKTRLLAAADDPRAG